MKRKSHLLVSIRSSYVNNHDACELVTRLNENVCNVAEKAREDELHKKNEKDLAAKLTTKFNNQWV